MTYEYAAHYAPTLLTHLSHPVESLDKHGPQIRGFTVEHSDLFPPSQAPLGDDDVKGADQDVVVERVGLRVEADLHGVAVVGIEAKVGQEEVNQQLLVVGDVAGSSGKGFLRLGS